MTRATATNLLKKTILVDEADTEFLNELEDCTLPPEEFGHRGHLRAAWLYLSQHGLEAGSRRFDTALRRYAAHLGVPDKYHCTLTHALLHLTQAAIRQSDGSWSGFERLGAHLFESPKEALSHHYSKELLESDTARRGFVPPDREPLP